MTKLGIPVVKLEHVDKEKNKRSKAKKPTGSVNIQNHGIPLGTK